MSTSNGGSKGFGGGDRIQATLVFERLDMSLICATKTRKEGITFMIPSFFDVLTEILNFQGSTHHISMESFSQ